MLLLLTSPLLVVTLVRRRIPTGNEVARFVDLVLTATTTDRGRSVGR